MFAIRDSPKLTKKVNKLIRKISGAPCKNCLWTSKLWPWPILIILHDICVAIPDLTKKVENLIREMSGAP